MHKTNIEREKKLLRMVSFFVNGLSDKITSFSFDRLSTQPPGPVILLGHSMGGLLAADAATDLYNNPDQYPGAKPKRIVGVVAFDTPYLGMHPHVVISGIASLLPKCKEPGKEQSNQAMNDQNQVKIVDEKVTDDWDEYKKGIYSALLGSRPFPWYILILFNSATCLHFDSFVQGFPNTKHTYIVNKLILSSIVSRPRPHPSTKFTVTISRPCTFLFLKLYRYTYRPLASHPL